jgi:hypothetical protein
MNTTGIEDPYNPEMLRRDELVVDGLIGLVAPRSEICRNCSASTKRPTRT